MNRTDLTTKQIQALEKIAAAGESGLPAMDGKRVSINGNCANALYNLGLIECGTPYHLTQTGHVALDGHDFRPARHVKYVLYSDGRQGFAVAPTFDRAQMVAEWDAIPNRGEAAHMTSCSREDVFRRAYPGVPVRGED